MIGDVQVLLVFMSSLDHLTMRHFLFMYVLVSMLQQQQQQQQQQTTTAQNKHHCHSGSRDSPKRT